jgi:hypothetical protein
MSALGQLPLRYSITLSARSRNASGIVRPSVLAVFRLTSSSNFVGCWTGSSPGLAPGLSHAVFPPDAALTVLGVAGTLTSVAGNEAAILLGRRPLIATAPTGSILLACIIALIGPWSYGLAVLLLILYGPIIWLDSSSLTAGAAGTAEPSKRGATLAVHLRLFWSVDCRVALNFGGGMSPETWAAAFLIIASLSISALIAFGVMRPREVSGDRETRSSPTRSSP